MISKFTTSSMGDSSEVEVKSFVGVIVAVCGNVLISVALNVQKYAHNKLRERYLANYLSTVPTRNSSISGLNATGHEADGSNGFVPDDGYPTPRASDEFTAAAADTEDDEESGQRRRTVEVVLSPEQLEVGETEYLKSRLWWLGILLMITGEVGNFIAYGFAPASTIAPLGTVSLVSNVIFAPLILKETFRKQDLLGIVLAVFGASVVVVSSKTEEAKLSPEAIWAALVQTQSLIYIVVMAVLVATLTMLSDRHGSKSILIDLGLVAIYGGFTVLATKGVSSMLSLTLYKMFTYSITYLLLFVLVFTAVIQIKYLNKALQRFDSTEVIPTQFVLFTISAITGSAVLYHDFENMDTQKMTRFVCGCLLEFLGVYLITSNRVKVQSGSLKVQADGLKGVAGNVLHDPFTRPRRDSIVFTTGESIDPLGDDDQLYSNPITTTASRRQSTIFAPFSSGSPTANTPLLGSYDESGDYATLPKKEGIIKEIMNGRISSATITGMQTALSSVGSRHSTAVLTLGQVYENYQTKNANVPSHIDDYEAALNATALRRRSSMYLRGPPLPSHLLERDTDSEPPLSPRTSSPRRKSFALPAMPSTPRLANHRSMDILRSSEVPYRDDNSDAEELEESQGSSSAGPAGLV